MKIFKKILLVLAILIIVPLIIGLFTKKDYAVERQITINKPKQQVWDYIIMLKNQNEYSKWALMDPNMIKEYKGTDGTVGFISAWTSNVKDVGKGEQEIIKIAPGERVDYELRFIEPFQAKDYAYMSTEAVSENQTIVKWGFTGKMNYPMNIMLLCMDMDGMLGEALVTGLTKMKSNLEK